MLFLQRLSRLGEARDQTDFNGQDALELKSRLIQSLAMAIN